MSLSASVAGVCQQVLLFLEFLKTHLLRVSNGFSHWLKMNLLTYQHVLITKQEQQETRRLEQTSVLATLTVSSLIQKLDTGPSSTAAAVQSEGIFDLYLGKVNAQWLGGAVALLGVMQQLAALRRNQEASMCSAATQRMLVVETVTQSPLGPSAGTV